MSPHDVALVVPVLNEIRILPELLAALERLGKHAETVVVDGGSTDGTLPALRRAAGTFQVLAATRGRANQMNVGAKATRAPALLFLHADTQLPDGALEIVADTLRLGALGGCFRLRISSRDPRLRLAAKIINLRSRFLSSASGDQAIFVGRAAFERIGGFRSIALCEDLDLVARVAKLGRFALADATVATSPRRWEENGINRTIALMWAVRLGYHLGIDPQTLHRLYGPDAR